MRINSASRSDIFNEYVKIISNFNKKRSIIKNAASIFSTLEDATGGLGNLSFFKAVNLLGEERLFSFFDPKKVTGMDGGDIKRALEIQNASKFTKYKNKIYLASEREGTLIPVGGIESAKEQMLKGIGYDPITVANFNELIKENGNIQKFLKDDILIEIKSYKKAPDQDPAPAAKPAAKPATAESAGFNASDYIDSLRISDSAKNSVRNLRTEEDIIAKLRSIYLAALNTAGNSEVLEKSIQEAKSLNLEKDTEFVEMLAERLNHNTPVSGNLEILNKEGFVSDDLFGEKYPISIKNEQDYIDKILTEIRADERTISHYNSNYRGKSTKDLAGLDSSLREYDVNMKSPKDPSTTIPSSGSTIIPTPKDATPDMPVAAPGPITATQAGQALKGMSEDELKTFINNALNDSNALHKQSIEAVERSLKELSENNQNLLSNVNNLAEQLKALKSATPEQTESIFSRAKSFLENLRKNNPPVNEKAIKGAEDLIKKLEAQTKTIKETEKSLKDSLKALSDAKAASTAPEKSKFIDFAKFGFVSGLLKLSAVGLLAIGVYNMVTADDSEESDVNAGASIYPSGEESGEVENIFNDTSKQGLKSDPFATPESRANFSEKLKNMPPDRREEVLGEVARRRGAVGSHTLSKPIRIGGERIETVFPSQAAASRSPLTPGRLQATEEYMYKLLENNGRKASNIKGRILADANSNDPQDIADYMFSTIANKGLFKGLGTMRAGRYGRGGAIDADSNKGFSGSRKERMTMKERRSLRDVAREEFDQNEEPSDQIMDSFASGYEEIIKKYSSDSEYSINNSEIMKKADKISKRYFKDAVKDLASDGFMSEYYAGFSKLYDSKVKKRKPDFKTLYGFQEETGADRIHEAHPEAIVVSDAIGRGGLVENASEASKAMQEVALSMPTGNYRARYAFIQNALKKASS